jgi:hypothetical protein
LYKEERGIRRKSDASWMVMISEEVLGMGYSTLKINSGTIDNYSLDTDNYYSILA